jgi:hypothetical protein
LGFVVVEVVVVEVVENAMDELEGVEITISVDKMVGSVSTEGIFSEVGGAAGVGVISGTVGCAPKVVNSSACIDSAIAAVADDVSLALAAKKIISRENDKQFYFT